MADWDDAILQSLILSPLIFLLTTFLCMDDAGCTILFYDAGMYGEVMVTVVERLFFKASPYNEFWKV